MELGDQNNVSDRDRDMMRIQSPDIEPSVDLHEKKGKKKKKRSKKDRRRDRQIEEGKRANQTDQTESEAEDNEYGARTLAQELIGQRQAEVAREIDQTTAGSLERVAALAGAVYLDNLARHIDDGETPNDQTLDMAVDESQESLDLNNFGRVAIETPDFDTDELWNEDDRGSVAPEPAPHGNNDYYAPQTSTASLGKEDNTTNNTATPSAGSGAFLAGGLLGYALGRHGGRIRAEKKLTPVRRGLENKVKMLSEKINLQEQQVRRLAYQKAESQPASADISTDSLKTESTKTVPELRQHNLEQKKSAPESITAAALVGAVLLDKGTRLEVAASVEEDTQQPRETVQLSSQETFSQKTESLPRNVDLKDSIKATPELKPASQSLSHNDVMDIARNMELEGVSFADMYKSGRINQGNLHKAVLEFMSGSHMEILAKKYVAPEVNTNSLEVDPIHRRDENMSEARISKGPALTRDDGIDVSSIGQQVDSRLDTVRSTQQMRLKQSPPLSPAYLSRLAIVIVFSAFILAALAWLLF